MAKKPVRHRKKQVREWQRRQGSRKLKPHELDIYHLLLLFVVWVKQGSQPTLATFTTWCWQELRFSYIFEARPPGLLKEAYVQLLYSLVLNCLAKGIPPSAAGHIAEALAAGPHAAAAAALSGRPRQKAQLLPAAGQEQQQQQLLLLQQAPGQVLHGGDGQAVVPEGQGPVKPLPGPHAAAAAVQAAPAQVTHCAEALPVVQQAQQAAAEQQQPPTGGVPPGLPVEAPVPGANLDCQRQPAGEQHGLVAELQGMQLNGSPHGAPLLSVPAAQEQPPQQPPGEQQRREGPISPLLLPTDPDLLPESELAALAALSPGLPQAPLHEGNLAEAAHHFGTGKAAGPHADLAELQLATSLLPADLDELLLGSSSQRLQSTPVKPSSGGSKPADAGAAQPPKPLHGGAVAPFEAGERGGEDHEDWLEQFVSQAADVPHLSTAAAAAAAGAAQPLQQSTGLGVPFMPSLVAGQAADTVRLEPQPAAAAEGMAAPAPAASPALSKEFVEGLIESAGLALPAGALLALYCLYCAQPGAPTVKVYLTPEHQAALLDVLPRLQQGGFLDSVAAARQLLRWEALVPGCTRAQAQLPPIVPGGGLRREEAGVAREVKYHLASTLRGLATKGLAQLCSDYEESLSTMWASLGDPSPPRNIADLGVLRLLHEFTEAKHAEAHAVLREGKRWQPMGRAAAGQPAAAAEAGGAHGRGVKDGANKPGSSKRAKQNGRQPASAAAAAARPIVRGAEHDDVDDDDDDEEEDAGDDSTARGEELEGLDGLDQGLDEFGSFRLSGPAERVRKRKLARKKALARRTRDWRQHMGVASAPAALQPLEGGAQPAVEEDDFDFDMPMLEGLEFGLASEAPPRTQQSLSARPGAATAAGAKGAQVQGIGSQAAAGHSEGPAPSSGTEATVEGGAPGPPRLPAARPSSASIPPVPTPAACAALGPPVKAKATGAKAAGKGAPGTANGKAAGAAGKRATAAKASPAVKATGGKKRAAATATSGAKPKAPKRARFADDAAAGTANGGPTAAATAKGARAGRRSNSAAGKASGAAASPNPAAAAATQAAKAPAEKPAAGLMNEAELASLAQQAQQAATLALQALAEDEDYDAQEPAEAQPALPRAQDASGPDAPVPPAQPSPSTAAAELLLPQPEQLLAPAETAANQSGHGKQAQQVGSVRRRQGSIRQESQKASPSPGQQRKQAAKRRRKAESAGLEDHATPGARQLRLKQGEAPCLPSAQRQEGSEASAAAVPPASTDFKAAAEPMAAASKRLPDPAGQPAGSDMNGKAKWPGAPEGSAAGAAGAATAAVTAAVTAAEAAGSPPGELDAWAARLQTLRPLQLQQRLL